MTTIAEIYDAINPLPALLSAKGKIKPEVMFQIEANARIAIIMRWEKRYASYSYEREWKTFIADKFEKALAEAADCIAKLPSAEQANLQEFMGKLGKLIDDGKENGIAVDYMNPLLDTMKRLSENVITYQRS